MSYFEPRTDGGLGCGGGCGCRSCRDAARRLGETYERDDEADEAPAAQVAGFAQAGYGPAVGTGSTSARLAALLRQQGARRVLDQLVSDGVRDENRLTDLLFFARHPERRNRRIGPDEAAAAREWHAVRERLIRPHLRAVTRTPQARRAAPPGAPGPIAAGTGGPCPIEDPLPRLPHPSGATCGAGGRKCWPASGRALDIVDPDLPCTSERNPAAYRAVLRYLNVADGANLRYARTPTSTFCNIFAHDATRLLRASIPHWVRDERQRSSPPIGWNEMNANATFDWLTRDGPAAGWVPVDPALVGAVQRPAGGAAGASDPGLPRALVEAAARINRARHFDRSLLLQDGYVAQQFANLGYPTVVAWKDPTGRPGHIAMVAPESPGSLGVRHPSGMYLPRTTQAGARNFEDGIDGWITGPRTRSRRFFVHA